MGFSGLRSLIDDIETHPSWHTRRQLAQVNEYWPKAVGYAVAQQTKPASIQRHILYVTVANASWAQTLTLERRRILHKLNRLITNPLSDIRFSSAQWHTKPIRKTQPVNNWIKSHPSYIGETDNEEIAPSQKSTKTPEEAFALWATAKKKQQKLQETCPSCQCSCPPGEIARWTMCALCITKTWQ